MDGEVQVKLSSFFMSGRKNVYRANDFILHAFDEPSGVIYVKNGYVRMYAVSDEGMELTLNIFKPGTFLPMTWALGDEEVRHDYKALTEVTIYKKTKEEVLEYLRENEDALMELTKRLVVGLSGLVNSMEMLFFGNARKRVINSVITTAKRFGVKNKNGELVIKLPLSHQDIANMSGLTRETTSLEMKKLDNEKLINYQRRNIVVFSIEKLEEKLEQ